MDKKQIWTVFLFQFKPGRKAAETARDINDAFGPGTTNERMAELWFKKFCNGEKGLKMKRAAAVPLRLMMTNCEP